MISDYELFTAETQRRGENREKNIKSDIFFVENFTKKLCVSASLRFKSSYPEFTSN